MSREFIKIVEKELAEMAKELGFKKKKTFFVRQVNEYLSYILVFSIATQQIKGHVLVCPQIGVCYKEINNMIEKMTEYSYFSTIQLALGYVMPVENWFDFDFVEGQDNSHALEALKANIITYGYPFVSKLSTLEGLLAYYEIDQRDDNGFKYEHLPIIYYMLGDKAKAMKIIEDKIAENKRQCMNDSVTTSEWEDDISETSSVQVRQYDKEYEEFAERFKQLPEKYSPDDWK